MWVSNGVDNCVEFRNFDVAHYSAGRFLDNNGNEQGAVGWANTNSLYALANKFADGGNDLKGGFDYLETFGLNHGFYFVGAGVLLHGIHSVSGDWVGFDGNTNVYYRFNRSTLEFTNNGAIKAGGHLYAGNSLGTWQMTKTVSTTEYLDEGAVDPASTWGFARWVYPTSGGGTAGTAIIDFTRTGTGITADS